LSEVYALASQGKQTCGIDSMQYRTLNVGRFVSYLLRARLR